MQILHEKICSHKLNAITNTVFQVDPDLYYFAEAYCLTLIVYGEPGRLDQSSISDQDIVFSCQTIFYRTIRLIRSGLNCMALQYKVFTCNFGF